MDAIIFTKDQFSDLMTKLDTIQNQIVLKSDPKKENNKHWKTGQNKAN